MFDFILNEEWNATEAFNSNKIKDFVIQNNEIITELINSLKYDNKEQAIPDHALHESILNVLKALVQYKETLVDIIKDDIIEKENLISTILSHTTEADVAEVLTKELELMKEIV